MLCMPPTAADPILLPPGSQHMALQSQPPTPLMGSAGHMGDAAMVHGGPANGPLGPHGSFQPPNGAMFYPPNSLRAVPSVSIRPNFIPLGAPPPVLGPMPVRHMPPPFPSAVCHADVRIQELNRRLALRAPNNELWWDDFVQEFFDPEAEITVQGQFEEGLRRFTIGHHLIGRYFRTFFDSGASEHYYLLKAPRDAIHNGVMTMECDTALMISHFTLNMPVSVTTICEGRLVIEFVLDDLMRIRHWLFQVHGCQELVPRAAVSHALQQTQLDQPFVEQLLRPFCRFGFPSATVDFFRFSMILEPMQELMTRHKTYGLSPRECLKATLFQKWQKMIAPPEAQRTNNSKRRKRKLPAGGVGAAAGGGKQSKKSPGAQPFGAPHVMPHAATAAANRSSTPSSNGAAPPLSQNADVMIVGEPTLMGGEIGEDDERAILRVENTQYLCGTAAASSSGAEADASLAEGAGRPGSGDAVGAGDPWAPDEKPLVPSPAAVASEAPADSERSPAAVDAPPGPADVPIKADPDEQPAAPLAAPSTPSADPWCHQPPGASDPLRLCDTTVGKIKSPIEQLSESVERLDAASRPMLL